MFTKLFYILAFSHSFGMALSAQSEDEITKKDSLYYEMDQVTVTATRYAESIIEVPYAVTIKTKDDFGNVKGLGLDEVLSGVPGVLSQSRNGNQDVRIVIRGFGARGSGDRSNSGTSRGIRILVDGIPETEPDGRTSFDQIDLTLAQNIEVLRSNVSALWGNASGGIINISSIPQFTSNFLEADFFAGSFGFQKFAAQIGTELGNGQIFGSLSQSYFDGWREHSSSKRGIINLGLISNLSKDTRLKVLLSGTSNLFHIPGPLTDSQFTANPKRGNPTYVQRDERRYNRLGKIGITLEHNFNESNSLQSMLYLNPKYLQRSERGTFRDFTRYHLGGNFIYQNIASLSEDIMNRIIVGIDEAYQDGAILFYSLSPTNSRGNTLSTNKREGANNFGAFIHSEIIINDRVSILIGGRYDNVSYYSEDFLRPQFGLQKKSYEKFTPKIALSYRFTPTHSIYANVSGGIEVPAGNETDPATTFGQDTVYLFNPLLDAIRSTTYEIGTKQILIFNSDLVKSLNYELALYHIQITNDIIPYRGGRFYFTAGKTRRTGVEFGASIQLKHGLSLRGSLTYSENKYVNYVVDSVHYGKPCKFADYSNNDAAGIPNFFYGTGFIYSPDFLKEIFISLELNGVGKYFVDDANKIEVPSYNLLNLSFGLTNIVKVNDYFGLRFFININNLTDEKYAASAFINPDLVRGQPVYLEPGLPRSITASVSFQIN
jgi:iron complex outermembrane receptor protein